MNLDALHAIIERDLIDSDMVHDYFHDDCVLDSPLEHECLLVAMYVYYFRSTQRNNFNIRAMSRRPRLNDTTKKLISIQKGLVERFGNFLDNEGREH